MTTVAVEECGKVHADALSMTSASDNTTSDDDSRSDCFMSYNLNKGFFLLNLQNRKERGTEREEKEKGGRERKERGKEQFCTTTNHLA